MPLSHLNARAHSLSVPFVVSVTRDRSFQNSEIERILLTGKLAVENFHRDYR